ncbi:MAG: patatin-like phospholipase family protein [Pseudomonadota bacterium]
MTMTDGAPRARRKQVLSLSGGGLRGLIAAAMLERLEQLGRERFGSERRLSDFFDLVGGASTGAVMATAVALGCEAKRIVAFYRDDAPQVFSRKRFAVPLVTELFSSRDR